MHLPTASQISCSITMGLGERGKLRYASKVQSRSITVNGIFQICVCMCILVCACVRLCAKCEHSLFGFVICKDCAEASLVCVGISCV